MITTFRNYFREIRPLLEDHDSLVGGWTEAQAMEMIYPAADLMADWSWSRKYAAGAFLRGLYVADKNTGRARYSRSHRDYEIPERYRDGDPNNTYTYRVMVADDLEKLGLIEQKIGDWGLRKQTVAWLTEKARAYYADEGIDPDEPPGLNLHVETIVLRDKNKRLIDYEDTPETVRMRAEMAVINEAIARTEVYRFGRRKHVPTMRRIFNVDWGRCGRLYCRGGSHQNMRKWARRDLEIAVDGVVEPVVEPDYSELHIRMAYREAGVKAPSGDLYAIPGYDRGAPKLAVNVMFNAKNRKESIWATAHNLHDGEQLHYPDREPAFPDCLTYTEGLVTAVENKHHKIRHFFNSDCGARFQRKDSDMAVEVILEMIERTGRCPLPVHDSFLAAESDEVTLCRVMKKVARRHHLPLQIRTKRQVHTTIEDLQKADHPLVGPQVPQPLPHTSPHPTTTTPPIHMWVTLYDLGKWVEGFWPEKALKTLTELSQNQEKADRGRAPP